MILIMKVKTDGEGVPDYSTAVPLKSLNEAIEEATEMNYAEGWDAGYKKGWDDGYKKGKEDEHRWWTKLCADCDGAIDEPQTSKIIEAYTQGYKDGAEAVKGIKDESQTDVYMTAEQTADYRKMLDNAVNKVYGNIFEDEPQTESNTRWRHKGDCLNCAHWEHGAHNHYYCALLEMGQGCFFESKDESTLMFAHVPQTEREGE